MNTQAEATLVALLREARHSRRLIERLPNDVMPLDEVAAYRVAARVAEESGLVVGASSSGRRPIPPRTSPAAGATRVPPRHHPAAAAHPR